MCLNIITIYFSQADVSAMIWFLQFTKTTLTIYSIYATRIINFLGHHGNLKSETLFPDVSTTLQIISLIAPMIVHPWSWSWCRLYCACLFPDILVSSSGSFGTFWRSFPFFCVSAIGCSSPYILPIAISQIKLCGLRLLLGLSV